MDAAGIILGFAVILIINSRKINMGISLFAGTLTAGLVMRYSPASLLLIAVESITEPVTLQLMIIMLVLSGFGYLLKKTGDLDRMIDSLVSLFRGGRILSIILPALVGTMAVPGGAILSAPMVDRSGEMAALDIYAKTAANVFFRHIGFLIYPLYSPMILVSELSHVSKTSIIAYDFLPMLVGLLAAYYIIFIRGHQKAGQEENGIKTGAGGENRLASFGKFLASFTPILSMLLLTLLFKLPFYLAVFAGLFIAAGRNLPAENRPAAYLKRLKNFFRQGVKYDLLLLVMGLMAFKGLIESSPAVGKLAVFLTETGIPLSIMIAVISSLMGYLTGMNLGSVGILVPIFLPLIPTGQMGLYLSLLFVSSFVGYIISPIHLCLVLTKEYFRARFTPVYRQLFLPLSLMVLTAVLQLNLF